MVSSLRSFGFVFLLEKVGWDGMGWEKGDGRWEKVHWVVLCFPIEGLRGTGVDIMMFFSS